MDPLRLADFVLVLSNKAILCWLVKRWSVASRSYLSHPAFQIRMAVELKWKYSMWFSSKEMSEPKFLPTMHCQVGKNVSSNSFLSSLARSLSWNLDERDARFCTNSIAFKRISTSKFQIRFIFDFWNLPSEMFDYSMRILLSPILIKNWQFKLLLINCN